MSTAGKVLVFLNLPLIIVWIALMSGVAHYNRLGTKAMDASLKQQAKLEEDIRAANAATRAAKDDLNIIQVDTSHTLAAIQEKKYTLQKQVSDATEAASRQTIALEEQQKALKSADLNRDHRIAERTRTEKELATAEEEVEKLKQVDRDQRDQLKKLRDEFSRIYKSNKLKVISSRGA
jgi:hypothetical protein